MQPEITEIIRTKRKTISLVINTKGELIVRAPLQTPMTYIEDLVQKKAAWITKKQEEMTKRNSRYCVREFGEGAEVLYLGVPLRLQYDRKIQEVTCIDGRLVIPWEIADKKLAVVTWYRTQARQVIGERLTYFASLTGLQYRSFNVTGAARRWGSCSSKGSVNFSWRLVMCPLPAIDYVIVHELCHLEHLNHSKDFWQKVKHVLPDYAEQRKWLADNQKLMDMI
ncbi:MAG: SprT family zinc-dependent metalloprotease [Bacillota bacterium]|nr:SprT family zinc-dependent metalloprotease [Bacillota bacterium]MDW7684558.1 SprT family zinc-dependent metalloprotease [Bacillota bacterium]